MPLAPGADELTGGTPREEEAPTAPRPSRLQVQADPGADRRCGHGGWARGDPAPSRLAHLRMRCSCTPRHRQSREQVQNALAQPGRRCRQRPTHSGQRVLNYLPRYKDRRPLPTQHFLQTKGFSASALQTAGARSPSVRCGVQSGNPALYILDAGSSSSPRGDNQQCHCPMSPRTDLPPTESTAL